MTLPSPDVQGQDHGPAKTTPAASAAEPDATQVLVQRAEHLLMQGGRAQEALALLTDPALAGASPGVIACLQGRCYLQLNRKPMVGS